jgi:hypothetical protein
MNQGIVNCSKSDRLKKKIKLEMEEKEKETTGKAIRIRNIKK